MTPTPKERACECLVILDGKDLPHTMKSEIITAAINAALRARTEDIAAMVEVFRPWNIYKELAAKIRTLNKE